MTRLEELEASVEAWYKAYDILLRGQGLGGPERAAAASRVEPGSFLAGSGFPAGGGGRAEGPKGLPQGHSGT